MTTPPAISVAVVIISATDSDRDVCVGHIPYSIEALTKAARCVSLFRIRCMRMQLFRELSFNLITCLIRETLLPDQGLLKKKNNNNNKQETSNTAN